MKSALTHSEYERLISNLKSRLSTEGWTIPDEQLHILAGVLPGNDRIPDASVATDTEAAFILGDTLLIASWDKTHAHLITDLISLSGTPLTIEWNADWLSEYGSDDSDEVPDDRPMTVIVTGPSGTKYVLPFDEAWHNPVGCIKLRLQADRGSAWLPARCRCRTARPGSALLEAVTFRA